MEQGELVIRPDRDDWEPGETVTGELHWSGLRSGRKVLFVRLAWHTEGKGDRSADIAGKVRITTNDTDGSSPFSLPAPHYPASFSGKLVSVCWDVEAGELNLPAETSARIVIAPDRRELNLAEMEQAVGGTAAG